MNIPEDLLYTKDHEWIRRDDGGSAVGITDYAQSELGDVVYVELPRAGTKVEAGRSFGTVESVKTVSELYAPVSGEVVEINAAVNDEPQIVNQDPYGRGWMIKIRPSSPGEFEALLSASAYTRLLP